MTFIYLYLLYIHTHSVGYSLEDGFKKNNHDTAAAACFCRELRRSFLHIKRSFKHRPQKDDCEVAISEHGTAHAPGGCWRGRWQQEISAFQSWPPESYHDRSCSIAVPSTQMKWSRVIIEEINFLNKNDKVQKEFSLLPLIHKLRNTDTLSPNFCPCLPKWPATSCVGYLDRRD